MGIFGVAYSGGSSGNGPVVQGAGYFAHGQGTSPVPDNGKSASAWPVDLWYLSALVIAELIAFGWLASAV